MGFLLFLSRRYSLSFKNKVVAESNMPCSDWFFVYTLIDVHLEKCFEVYKALVSVGSTSRLGGKEKFIF